MRLDKFLVKEFFSLSRGEIIRKIKSSQILVNNKNAKPSYILRQNDKVIHKPSDEKNALVENKKLNIEVIYQDENIIVINKPAGIQVHPDNRENENTIVNWLIYKFPEIKNVYESPKNLFRPGIVHRLDKDTSGVMVVARNINAFLELKKLFHDHKVEKKYLVIVYGKLNKKSGTIEKPIARANNYKKQAIAGRKTKTKIRAAVTHYQVIKEFDNYSLLEVTPRTGRMHQIRVHLFSIGHPVAGDKLYKLKSKTKPSDKKRLNIEISRQMLHAERIKFKLFGKNYSFSSPVPEDFQKTQKSLFN